MSKRWQNRATFHVDFHNAGAAERDFPAAMRAPRPELRQRLIVSEGRRYLAVDAHSLFDLESALQNARPGFRLGQ